MKNQVFGILDCMILLLFFLPFFGVKSGDSYRAVSLLSYTGVLRYTWNAYIVVVSVSGLYGMLQLILHNLDNRFWIKNRAVISVGITFLGIGIFITNK